MTESAHDAPPSVAAAWSRVVDAWQDDALHDALFTDIARTGSYAWAARVYSERKGDPIADRQLAKIVRAAEATMRATATQLPEKTSPRYQLAVLVVLAIAALIGLLYMLAQRQTSAATPDPTTEPR